MGRRRTPLAVTKSFHPMHRRLLALILTLAPVLSHAAPASENWANRCAKCHGMTGNGQTKIGAQRFIKDYTDAKVQAQFTDAGLLKNLLLGVQTADGKERMPSFKDQLSVAEAKDLIALIRSFGKPSASRGDHN